MTIVKKRLLISTLGFLSFAGVVIYIFLGLGSSAKSIPQAVPVSTRDQKNTVKVNPLARKVARELLEPEQQKIKGAIKYSKILAQRNPISPNSKDRQMINPEVLKGTRWKLVTNYRAIKEDHATGNEEQILKFGNQLIIEVSEDIFNFHEFRKSALPVVYDSRLKKMGVVTGLIVIETGRKDLLLEALKPLDAVLINSFDDIKTYYVTVEKEVFDLEVMFENLNQLNFIENITLDISDRVYDKK